MAEQVVQSGRLGDLPLIDLVMAACRMKHPSILRLERGGNRRDFFFRDQELVALTASNPAESLTAMLVRRKKMQQSVADAVLDVAERDQIGEAAAIMRDRILPIPELVKEMNIWATLLVVSSFGWAQGTWSVVLESVDNAPPDALLELHLPATLLRGVSKKLEVEEVRAMLGPYFDDAPRRSDDAPFAAVTFDLDARQQALLDALDGQRTLRELVSFSPVAEEDALRLLYVLQRMGMLEFGAVEEVATVGDAPGMAPTSASQPAAPTPQPEPEPEPPASSGAGGLDWGSIRFSRRERTERAGAYATTDTTGNFERVNAGTTGKTATVEVGVGHAPDESAEEASVGTGSSGLAGLFDGISAAPSEPRPRAIKPPRAGKGGGTWRAADEAPAVVPSGGDTGESPRPQEPETDAPPEAPGLQIDAADWARMSTKDKERVRAITREIARLPEQNYFEWFGLPNEAPKGSVKKAFFKMARMYHPDSLIDEGDVYRAAAETIFAKYTEAYETLDDDEKRDKYVRKHIHGEKDEDDLAMEKVQQILAAEGSFRDGLRRLQAGNLAAALKKFKEAVEGYDEEAEYVAYYGYTLFRARVANNPDEADRGVELIKKATELKPMANKPWHLLGKVYLQTGHEDPQRAKKYLRKSLQLNADDPECVRDYRRADELAKSPPKADKGGGGGGGLKGLFGKFGKKKDEPKKDDLDFKMDDLDFDF